MDTYINPDGDGTHRLCGRLVTSPASGVCDSKQIVAYGKGVKKWASRRTVR